MLETIAAALGLQTFKDKYAGTQTTTSSPTDNTLTLIGRRTFVSQMISDQMAWSGSRVLVIGGTGHVGRRIVNASLSTGHPTFVLARPPRADSLKDSAQCIRKAELLVSIKQAGARILEGSIQDHQSVVSALKQVDVVISTLGESQILQQLKLIPAIKEAGTIKRFLPSEFGMDVDRMENAIPPGDKIFAEKRRVRRAIEAAGIPYTYVSANCLAGYFLAGLSQFGHFLPPRDKASVYGERHAKVIWVAEEDVAAYAIRTIDDPRTVNKTLYIRPPRNILSHTEVVEIWESVCGKVLEKVQISEEDWLAQIKDESLSMVEKVVVAHFYHIFYKGELANFDLDAPNQMEATTLYPEVVYTTVPSYLSRLIF